MPARSYRKLLPHRHMRAGYEHLGLRLRRRLANRDAARRFIRLQRASRSRGSNHIAIGAIWPPCRTAGCCSSAMRERETSTSGPASCEDLRIGTQPVASFACSARRAAAGRTTLRLEPSGLHVAPQAAAPPPCARERRAPRAPHHARSFRTGCCLPFDARKRCSAPAPHCAPQPAAAHHHPSGCDLRCPPTSTGRPGRNSRIRPSSTRKKKSCAPRDPWPRTREPATSSRRSAQPR